MCYPVCGMVHIKEPLLLIGKSNHVAAAGFLSRYLSGPLPLYFISIFEWSFTICPTPYNRHTEVGINEWYASVNWHCQ